MKQVTIPYVSWDNPTLDGLASRLELEGKRLSIDVLNWEQDFPYRPICVVDVAYCDQGILLHYFVRSLDLRTMSPGDGNYVHEDSCVEFFMQREAGDAYINFEFNAAGVCYAAHHASPSESILLSPEEFATITRQATHQGKRLEQTDGIHEWELEALIPWTTMGYPEGVLPERMRANFYKCGDGTAHPHYVSWAPIVEVKPAFHRPQFFGELIFAR